MQSPAPNGTLPRPQLAPPMNFAIAFLLLIAATPSADTPPPAAGIPEPIAKQMREIIIPRVEFEEVELDGAVDYLRMKSADHERKKGNAAEGMSFVVLHPTPQGGAAAPPPEAKRGLSFTIKASPDAGEQTVSLRLKKIPMIEALDILCAGVDRRWFLAGDGKIIIGPKPGP